MHRLRALAHTTSVLAAALLLLAPLGCASKPVEFTAHTNPALSELHTDAVVRTIAFGSCAQEDKDQPIWDAIIAQDPDLFLFIGDNVYADIPDVPETAAQIRSAYRDLAEQPGWQALNDIAPVLATWDDHDYGLNDAGTEWKLKQAAQQVFLDFYHTPEEADARRSREGIYSSYTAGPEGKRLQVIMLDTRYHRTPITRAPIRPQGRGPYTPNTTTDGTILGETQWNWLEAELQKPADLRIIASSIQVVADEHGWETWGNMPHERTRLFDLINTTDANAVVFISGDRHLIEFSRDPIRGPYPIWDFTSSGFNWGERNPVREPNRFRVGPVLREPNFGVIKIDWSGDAPSVRVEGRGLNGQLLMEQSFEAADLRVSASR